MAPAPVSSDLSVPRVYHDLASMFSKQCALSLPPHRPYNRQINLLPDVPLPSSWFYNLSTRMTGKGEIHPLVPGS